MDDSLKKRLKPIVNNPETWEVLDKYFETLYNKDIGEIIRTPDMDNVKRLQGRVQLLKHLQSLRDIVNVA